MKSNRTYRACNVRIAAVAASDAVREIVEAALNPRPLEVHLCNAHTLTLAQRDTRLAAALARSDLNLPDGTPVAWLGRKAGVSKPVRGPSLVGDVLSTGISHGIRHYLYGGHEGVADQMAGVLRLKYPGAQIVGAESPPFRPLTGEDLDQVAARARKAGASMVWVGLGTPKQDYLVPELADRLQIPVVPVGAAFDFWTGRVAEAPRALHGSGLEWLYRLAKEPRRLWRRYLLGNPYFICLVLRERLAPQGRR